MKRLLPLLAAACACLAQVSPVVPGLEPAKAPAAQKTVAPSGRGGRGAATPAEKPAAARGSSPRDLKYPALHSVQPPRLVTGVLPNGLKLYLSEQHDVPTVGGVVMVRTGEAFDPPERIGLAGVAGYLLRNGGTELKSGEQLDDTLSALGMAVEADVGPTSATLTFSGLARNAEPALALLREILAQPAFRLDRLEQAKARLRHQIAHRNDDIPALERRELASLIFGKDSPYGWQLDYSGLERITRTDLKNFHHRFFFPGNVMLGIWGDFDAARMQAMVEKAFGDWSGAAQAVPAFPKAAATPAPGFYLGEKRDVPVTHLLVGQPSGTVQQKDYPALEVMGLMFNQLQARITQRVRSQLGTANLTLRGVEVDDVAAAWGAGFDHAGIFRIYGTCRGPATVEAIQAVHEEIERLRSAEVDAEELRIARDSALAELSSAWDTYPKGFLRMMTQEYYGLPRDFAQQHQAGLEAVTRADILRVAKQYLAPAGMTTVVVGNPQVFSTPLEKLNPQINRIDLTVPEPKPVVTESTDTSIAEGKKLLERAQAAVGGADKLAAVKDYLIASEYQLDPGVPDIGGYKVPQTDRWIFPAIFRQDLELPTQRISAYSDGKSGWIATRQGWGALAGVQLKQLQGDLFRSYFRLLISDRLEGRTVNLVDQDLVEIADTTGQVARIEFDPKTGLPRRATYDIPQAAGAPLFTEDLYSDYREVGGIRFPFRTVITQGGRKFADVVITSVKINSGLRQAELALRPQ